MTDLPHASTSDAVATSRLSNGPCLSPQIVQDGISAVNVAPAETEWTSLPSRDSRYALSIYSSSSRSNIKHSLEVTDPGDAEVIGIRYGIVGVREEPQQVSRSPHVFHEHQTTRLDLMRPWAVHRKDSPRPAQVRLVLPYPRITRSRARSCVNRRTTPHPHTVESKEEIRDAALRARTAGELNAYAIASSAAFGAERLLSAFPKPGGPPDHEIARP